MEKKVLVVGGAGYIGGAVTDILLEKNIPFTVYDNLTYESYYLKDVDFVYGDIRNRTSLSKLLKKYSHVVWLAALVGDPICELDQALTFEINTKSVNWLSKTYTGRITFMSTCAIYGQSRMQVTETSRVNPITTYAKSKKEAESFLIQKNALIFRLGTVFGVGDTYSRPRMDLAANIMTAHAVTKNKLTVFGGNQWRSFVHVRTVAETIVNNLFTEKAGIFNIATENMTILDLAKSIQKHTGCEIDLKKNRNKQDGNYNTSSKKAIEDGVLNLKTAHSMDHGIKQVAKIIGEKRLKNYENTQFSNVEFLKKNLDNYRHY